MRLTWVLQETTLGGVCETVGKGNGVLTVDEVEKWEANNPSHAHAIAGIVVVTEKF